MFQVPSFKPQERGITLVEIILVVFIMSIFFMIVIADFPKISRQTALSRVAYKFAQDLRKAEDLGLSGVVITNDQTPKPVPIETIKGYGIYVDISHQPATNYIVYADIDNSKTYNPGSVEECGKLASSSPQFDCIIEAVDISQENKSLSIKSIVDAENEDILGSSISINFTPPGPLVTIKDDIHILYSNTKIGIVFQNTDKATRTVWINTAGLIDVQ